ncbi:MAG: hypothetical protein KIT48_09030 [Pseudolabrys sp.]|nr:hypothetical protein [Pseudolabrys sp.]
MQRNQPIGPPAVSDPHKITETFVNGPISLNIVNGLATLTLTTIRPDLHQAMSGAQVSNYDASVSARLVMPLNMLLEMKQLLNRSLQEQHLAGGSARPQ